MAHYMRLNLPPSTRLWYIYPTFRFIHPHTIMWWWWWWICTAVVISIVCLVQGGKIKLSVWTVQNGYKSCSGEFHWGISLMETDVVAIVPWISSPICVVKYKELSVQANLVWRWLRVSLWRPDCGFRGLGPLLYRIYHDIDDFTL